MQTELFAGTPTGVDRYTWQEGLSLCGNPYYRLIDNGEETRWWVRHHINCKMDQRCWFVLTGYGAYIPRIDDVNKAKAMLLELKDGA